MAFQYRILMRLLCEQGDACWYFGLVDEHVLIKHAFLGPASRVWIVKAAAAASILLLVARAGVFREGAGREWDKEGIAKLIGDLRSVLPGAALLLLLLALVYYTAHHMGQVFIPFCITPLPPPFPPLCHLNPQTSPLLFSALLWSNVHKTLPNFEAPHQRPERRDSLMLHIAHLFGLPP
jgi:hypothetical protein